LNPDRCSESSRSAAKAADQDAANGRFATVAAPFATGSAPPGSTANDGVLARDGHRTATVRGGPDGALVAKALAVLAALGGDHELAERGRVLAEAILEREEVRLALEICEGGDMALRRSIELAALVLAAAHRETRQ
jgi:hypothetical protein